MASYFPMVKNSAQRIVFPILDADGDPVTGAASDTPDSEYSLDGDSFADITDEIHELATASGIYYLDLSADETNGDVVCVQVKTATAGTKTTVLVFYTSAQSLNTIDGVVDAIKAITDNLPNSGALSDLAAILTDTGTTLPATLATIATYIDTEVAAIITDLDNETDGLGALKALLDTISGYTDLIDDATNGLAAIKAEVEGIGGVAMRGTDSAALASAWTAALATVLANYTAARAGYLDELAAANLPTDITTLKTYCDILDHATNGLANIKSLIDTLDTVADAVKAKTDLLPSGMPKGEEFTPVFVMVLSSDHITRATGKTIVSQISKDGGAFANTTNSVAEIGSGWYKVTLTATEMNATSIALKFTETDCDQTDLMMGTST